MKLVIGATLIFPLSRSSLNTTFCWLGVCILERKSFITVSFSKTIMVLPTEEVWIAFFMTESDS